MSRLNQLLDSYAPPPAPDGLAARAVAVAMTAPQDRRSFLAWRRAGARGGWRRGALIGGAAIGLAFTSAVAAEVASGGRIEIPVVHQVVEAVPILKATAHPKPHPVRVATVEQRKASVKPAVAEQAPEAAPATPRERFVRKFADAQKQVAERRAAGLPTPNADRIERKAKRMIERREAAGLPAPSLDEAEMRVALREWIANRMLRQVANNPSAITDVQVQRFARILPPNKRTQFLALGPDQQRELMGKAAQRFLARRAHRQQQQQQLQADNPPPAEVIEQPGEGSTEPAR